jgi:hypothetical protein
MATISRTGISGGGTIQPAHITNIIDALDGTSATTTVIATGSFTGSLIGTLTGTASFATTALSASYAANVPTTASYALAALSSSYAVTASFALNAGGSGTGFPFTGSAQISGSLGITGSAVAGVNALSVQGSVYVDNTATGELDGRIIGGGNLRLDLSELGKSGTTGFLNIPIYQPGSPNAGYMYWDDVNAILYIYSATNSNWYNVQLNL